MTESTVKDDAILQCSIFIFFAEGRRHDKILESDQSLFFQAGQYHSGDICCVAGTADTLSFDRTGPAYLCDPCDGCHHISGDEKRGFQPEKLVKASVMTILFD